MYQVPVPAKPWTPVWPLNDSRLGSNIVQAYLKCQIPAYVMDVKPSITRIQSVVCREMDVEIIDMTSDRRTQKPTLARQIAMYLVRTMTHRSMPEIGRRFGGRDHTTVLHAFRKIGERRKCDPELDQLITNLANLIG